MSARTPELTANVERDARTSRLSPQLAEAWRLGLQPYVPVWQAMLATTESAVAGRRRVADRTAGRASEAARRGASNPCGPCQQIWTVQHPPVFTLGRNARVEALLDAGSIPVVRVDRGGQVTLHAPGQLVVYLLFELDELEFGVRSLVERVEQAMIDTAGHFGCLAQRRPGAPGIYVGDAKLGALGLRVTRGRTLHGLSFNVTPRLALFERMHPCGYADLATTSLHEQGVRADLRSVESALLERLSAQFGFDLRSRSGLPPELLQVQARGAAAAAIARG